MKYSILIILSCVVSLSIGCAKASSPISMPVVSQVQLGLQRQIEDHNRHCWAYGFIQVNEDHTSFDWVPLRSGEFHLNALNLLENGPCKNCVSIGKIVKEGNGIVDIDVSIMHPFPGLLQYTGFDVKGIIMFNGSFIAQTDPTDPFGYRVGYVHPEIFPLRLNMSFLGDWALLNPDGYSIRWSPAYLSGQDAPMFKYIQGKYALGLPNSSINAYINFYTDENRHMFMPGQKVTKTYRIQTQPGPMTIGYAVEACWEPQTVMPVTNPATDFPISANQSEPYVERYYLNDGQPITEVSPEFPIYVQYREWPSVLPNNATSAYFPWAYVGGKWKNPGSALGGPCDDWRSGPEPGTDDVYKIFCKPNCDDMPDCLSFGSFSHYNGYYVWLRFTWYQVGGYPSSDMTGFNPSVQVVQINIPGNDP